MKDKLTRQKKIAQIIKQKPISTQGELLKHLKREGIKTTQATLSRDVQELGIIYVPDRYYQMPSVALTPVTQTELTRRFSSYVTDIKHTSNLIVVKTLPGEASGTARLIDGLNLNDVLGTVAGDDTFLIVVKNKQSVNKILSLMKKGENNNEKRTNCAGLLRRIGYFGGH